MKSIVQFICDFLDWLDVLVKRGLRPASNLWENETGHSHYYLASLLIVSGISIDVAFSLMQSIAGGLLTLFVHWYNFLAAFSLFYFGRMDDDGNLSGPAVPSFFGSCWFFARWFMAIAAIALAARDWDDLIGCLLISAGYHIVSLPGIPKEDRVSWLTTVMSNVKQLSPVKVSS